MPINNSPIDWRIALYASPAELVPLVLTQVKSPFKQMRGRGRKNNQYHRWVTDLKGASGIYIIGWQLHADQEPIFYIGCSTNWVYTTLVQHFRGNYGDDLTYNIQRPRAVIQRRRYSSCMVTIIECPPYVVRNLEQRTIWAFDQCGFRLVNNRVSEPAALPSPRQILDTYPSEYYELHGWLRGARTCITMNQQLYWGVANAPADILADINEIIRLYDQTLAIINPPF